MDKNWKDLWEYHYSENLKYVPRWPSNFAIKFFGRISKSADLKDKKALDLGCGGSKDLILIYKMGMSAYGIEISENAIKFAKKYIKEWDAAAEIRLYSGKNIPYPDEFFDFVISLGVLDHMKFSDALSLISEINRVLTPGGYFCASLHSVRDSNYRKGRRIEKNTFITEEGNYELGLPQHYYNEKEILKLFKNFKVERVFLEEEGIVDLKGGIYNLNNKDLISKSSFVVIYGRKWQ